MLKSDDAEILVADFLLPNRWGTVAHILFISKSFAPCYLHLRNMFINTDYNSSCFIADIFKNITQCIKYIMVIVMVTQNGCFSFSTTVWSWVIQGSFPQIRPQTSKFKTPNICADHLLLSNAKWGEVIVSCQFWGYPEWGHCCQSKFLPIWQNLMLIKIKPIALNI